MSGDLHSALLEVRALPWRPRKRAISGEKLRETVGDLSFADLSEGIEGFVVSLAFWLVLLIAAPFVVVLLAVVVFSVELPIVALFATLLIVGRFLGLIPWQVLIVDHVHGSEDREAHRNLFRAIGRVREINQDRRVRVRWSWT